MTEQILVPFEGESSGAGELTWGQLDIWAAMQRQQSSLGVGGAFPLPPGTTVADVAADLRFLMSRHESLRTRLRFAADGRPQQVVAKCGEARLTVVDPGDGDPAEVAAALHARYEDENFDYATDWPVRWAVIARDGVATHLVTIICHLAIDAMGAMAILEDLASRDPVTGEATGPVTAPQPRELAEMQRTAPAGRQNSAALRYWERTLRSIPARRFASSEDKRSPRYWQATYDSAASYLAMRLLTDRTAASTSTILLAAFAVVLTRVTGSDPAVVQVVVDNRFRPGLASVVSPLCTSVPCVIDVADRAFDEVIARVGRLTMNAYKMAYYNPAERAELEARINEERGEIIDLSCYFNDRRIKSLQEPGNGALPAADELREALRHSTLTWGWRRDRPCDRCFLSVNNSSGTLCCELYADTHYLPPAGIEECLRGLEAVLVGAALGWPAGPSSPPS
jgi:hypothetical protein